MYILNSVTLPLRAVRMCFLELPSCQNAASEGIASWDSETTSQLPKVSDAVKLWKSYFFRVWSFWKRAPFGLRIWEHLTIINWQTEHKKRTINRPIPSKLESSSHIAHINRLTVLTPFTSVSWSSALDVKVWVISSFCCVQKTCWSALFLHIGKILLSNIK